MIKEKVKLLTENVEVGRKKYKNKKKYFSKKKKKKKTTKKEDDKQDKLHLKLLRLDLLSKSDAEVS